MQVVLSARRISEPAQSSWVNAFVTAGYHFRLIALNQLARWVNWLCCQEYPENCLDGENQ